MPSTSKIGEHRPRRDRGGASILVMTAVVAIAVAIGAAMASTSTTLIDRVRAQSAADAAALASVRGGRAAAEQLAAVNGASLVSWRQIGPDVVVEVRAGAAVATARATDAP